MRGDFQTPRTTEPTYGWRGSVRVSEGREGVVDRGGGCVPEVGSPHTCPQPVVPPTHCRCRPGRGRSWGSARPPSPPSSPTASAGATATCGSPSPRDATSDVSCPPGLLWAPVPLLQWPLAQESPSPFLFLGNFVQPSSLLVKWGSGVRWGSRMSFVILEAGSPWNQAGEQNCCWIQD